MSRRITEISEIIPIGGLDLPAGDVAAYFDDETYLHGGCYGTHILPEYLGVYDGVHPLLKGLVARGYAKTRPPGEEHSMITTIFGFRTREYTTASGVGRMLVPNIIRAFLPGLPNPDLALHGYHTLLVQDTNQALEALDSPYRLAPIPPLPEI